MAKRRALIAGNWKMNALRDQNVELAQAVMRLYRDYENPQCDVLMCPPFTFVCRAFKICEGTGVMVGAQDCSPFDSGAHTGDISAPMLKELGCSHIIVGHSERRTDHKESNALVKSKAEAVIKQGMTAIICIGETEAERDAGKTIDVCREQFMGSVPDDSDSQNVVIAYEPVWAIGTGKTPTTQDVADVHAAIRAMAKEKMGKEADSLKILYGGSVKPNNAKELLSLEDVDGALVGGASLKAEDFWAIISARI